MNEQCNVKSLFEIDGRIFICSQAWLHFIYDENDEIGDTRNIV